MKNAMLLFSVVVMMPLVGECQTLFGPPLSKMAVLVVDETGVPVSNAYVNVYTYWAKGANLEGFTDTNGVFRYKDRVYREIGSFKTATANGAASTYAANALNQYTYIDGEQLAYDLDGNLTSDGVMMYKYDCENRLVAAYSNSVCVVSNAYDYMSRRIFKSTPSAAHTFVYDGWNLIQEKVEMSDGTTSVVQYHWGVDLSGGLQGAGGVGRLVAVSIDGGFFMPLYDNNGNITAYIDEQGSAVASYVYDVFGATISQSGSMADTLRFRFSTKYLDDETGLYYYGYRFYSPSLRRWLNHDPIEERRGAIAQLLDGVLAPKPGGGAELVQGKPLRRLGRELGVVPAAHRQIDLLLFV